VQVDLFSSFFYCRGRGGWRLMFFFLLSFDMWKEEGKGMIFFIKKNFIVEWLGIGGQWFFF